MKATKKLSRKQVYGFVSERQDVELEIGDWVMSDLGKLVPHGLTIEQSKTIKIEGFWIRNDGDESRYHNSPYIACSANDEYITLNIIAEGIFDNVDFDTATGYSRGKIFFSYIKDSSSLN